ncbi:unnamed protein product [Somion occarium]|uniref:F-box domain-containing protein n=1 Tax=Somion occarium TaxID=3059160 RepID=A0ABP1CVB8_9APHY
MPTTIASLPAELLLDIFAIACTDTGYTGCCLTAVSQRFRALCTGSGVDIENVVVNGVEKMEGFLAVLERREKRARRVKNLLLTDRVGIEDTGAGGNHCVASTSSETCTTSPVLLLDQILRSVSEHDLRILTIHLPHYRLAIPTSPSVFSTPFPSLTDLTLYAALDFRFFEAFYPCPSLKRLHIAAHNQLPKDFGGSINRIAPHLTHLRLSAVRSLSTSGNLPEVLRAYSNPVDTIHNATINAKDNRLVDSIANTNNDAIPINHELPSSVHTLIIGFITFFQSCVARRLGREQINYLQTTQALRQLADSSNHKPPVSIANAGGRKLVVCPTPAIRSQGDIEEDARECYTRLRMEWEERVAGREAGWDVMHQSIS